MLETSAYLMFLSLAAWGFCSTMSKRSPARVMIMWLLHVRAGWMWLGVVGRKVAEAAPRYRECLEQARREV